MTRYLKVTIARPDGFRARHRGAYHVLLRDRVYPLVDELQRLGMIEGYDFLSHSGLDLRLWVADDTSVAHIQDHLRNKGLPDQLVDDPPSENGLDRELLLAILQRSAEQTRDLLEDGGRTRRLEELVHWLLNQWGLHNRDEVRFHEACARSWAPPRSTGPSAMRMFSWIRKLHFGRLVILSLPLLFLTWLFLVVIDTYLQSLDGCPVSMSVWDCKIPAFWMQLVLWLAALAGCLALLIASWWTWFGARRSSPSW